MKRWLVVGLCVVLFLFSGAVFGEYAEEVEVPGEYREVFVFGTRILRDYYGNKDLSEHRDLSGRVSPPMEKLLNAKIEMDVFQREKLNLEYDNYFASLLATSMESWSMKKDEFCFSVQVTRTWNYKGVKEKSGSSEVWNLRVKKSEDGMQLIECFEAYENMTLGPIDEKAKRFSEKNYGSEYDAFLRDYVRDFKEQCVEKSGGEPVVSPKEPWMFPSKRQILMGVMSVWILLSVFSL